MPHPRHITDAFDTRIEPWEPPRDRTGPASSFGLTDDARTERITLLHRPPQIDRRARIPLGVDGQGRHPHATPIGMLTTEQMQRYSTGHPIAGEAVPEDDDDRPPITAGARTALAVLLAMSATIVILAGVLLYRWFTA